MGVLQNMYLIYPWISIIGARVLSEFPLIGQGNNSGTKAVRLGETRRLDSNVINLACRHDCKHSNIVC